MTGVRELSFVFKLQPSLVPRQANSYSAARRPDPRIHQQILMALGDAQSVLNVGAGTGNYEPTDRWIMAVEPSFAMIAQRRPGAAPAVRAVAEALPFGDQTFDASLAVLTCTIGPTWQGDCQNYAWWRAVR